MLSVNFYNTSSDNIRVNKSLASVGSYSCDLLEECSVDTPKIIVNASASLAVANFAYIEAFHRYYYAKATILDGNRIQFDLSVDRLMSFVNPYKASITAYIERNQNKFNKAILDDQAMFTNDRDIITKIIVDPGFDYNGRNIEDWKLIGVFNAGLCNTAQPANNS